VARPNRPAKKISTVRWKAVKADSQGLNAGSTAVNIIAADEFPQTIMRTRGELVGFLDSLDEPPVLVRWAFGIACLPQGQANTVRWSPLADGNAPWFVYLSGFLGYEEHVADVVQSVSLSSFRVAIDSKAMRKCLPDTEIQAVFEQETIGAAGAINLAFSGRILIGR